MKKLFTMMIASLCGTMAYAAQSEVISLKNVTMKPGTTETMEVVVNSPSNYTAFQFDLKLPKGISVKDASMKGTYGSDRKLEKKLIDQNANKYRFLSYDMKNATLTGTGVVANITLEAGSEAESGILDGSSLLVVTPQGQSTSVASASANLTIEKEVSVSISAAKQAIVCSDKNLDFSNVSNVKAYIVTGSDRASGKIWLSRVYDVPANTAVLIMGEEGNYPIPVVSESKTIYENMLVGSLTGTTITKNGGDNVTNYILSNGNNGVGFYYAKESGSEIRAGGGYLPLPTTIAPVGTEGSVVTISMNAYGMRSYYSDQSLDFSNEENLKAYTATGYDKNGVVRLTRRMQVAANTGILLMAPAEAKNYNIPSASLQQCYSNMFKGTLTGTTIYKFDNDIVNYYVSVVNDKVGYYLASADGTPIPANGSWLPVPKSMTSLNNATTRGISESENLSVSLNDEVIVLRVLEGFDGNGTTGIHSINQNQLTDDIWFNLNGQRIDTPTRKGLYIKNGKKVVVK